MQQPRRRTLFAAAEDAIVDQTREIVPGMVVCGMEVAEVAGKHPP